MVCVAADALLGRWVLFPVFVVGFYGGMLLMASLIYPPDEIVSFFVQPAILGGRGLAGRALDQRGKAVAVEPADLDAPRLGLRVELCQSAKPRPPLPRAQAGSAARRGGRLPQTARTSRHPSFAGPAHSDNRMTLAICTHTTEGTQVATTDALEETSS